MVEVRLMALKRRDLVGALESLVANQALRLSVAPAKVVEVYAVERGGNLTRVGVSRAVYRLLLLIHSDCCWYYAAEEDYDEEYLDVTPENEKAHYIKKRLGAKSVTTIVCIRPKNGISIYLPDYKRNKC